MATVSAIEENEVAILDRLIHPDQADLSVAAARAILKLDFTARDRERMRELAQKARDGTLTAKEQKALDSYERVGHLIDLLHSKARRALKKHGGKA